MQVTRDGDGEPAQLAGTPGSSPREATPTQQEQDEGVAAFEYLCRRHVGPAWGIAYAVTGQRRDAAAAVVDAFVRVLEPGRTARFDSPAELDTALLTASRAAANEVVRRPDAEHTGEVALGPGGDDGGMASRGEPESGSRLPVVTAAYRSLPERWRSVLWLTEVRHASEAEATAVLGVSSSGLAQLSLRARSGLRERYLRAHLQGTMVTGCRPVVEQLAAIPTNELPPDQLSAIEGHLRGCDECRERAADLDDLGAMLAGTAAPVPAALVSMTTSRWKAAANAANVVSRSRQAFLSFPPSGRKPLAGAALTVMGMGIIGAAVVTGPLLTHGHVSAGLAPAATAPTEINQPGATGGPNPYLLSGSQSPIPTSTAPAAPTTTAGASTAVAHAATAAPATSGAGPSGGQASSSGLPPTPVPSTTVVPPLPPPLGGGSPLPSVTLPPPLPPLTVTTTIPLPKVTLPKIP